MTGIELYFIIYFTLNVLIGLIIAVTGTTLEYGPPAGVVAVLWGAINIFLFLQLV